MIPRRRKAALTLVELLVTTCFLVLVGATVFATFSGGFRIWERVQNVGAQDRLLQIVLEQIRRDLANCRSFGPIGFVGQYDEMSFPELELFQFARGRLVEEREELGRVGYFFDSYHRTLCRSKQSYRVIRRYRVKESCQPLLTDLDRVRFSYCSLDPYSGAVEWSSNWEEKTLPVAVKIEIDYQNAATHQQRNQTLIVPLPAAPIQKR